MTLPFFFLNKSDPSHRKKTERHFKFSKKLNTDDSYKYSSKNPYQFYKLKKRSHQEHCDCSKCVLSRIGKKNRKRKRRKFNRYYEKKRNYSDSSSKINRNSKRI